MHNIYVFELEPQKYESFFLIAKEKLNKTMNCDFNY